MDKLIESIRSFFLLPKAEPELHCPVYDVEESPYWIAVRENKVRTINDYLAMGTYKPDDDVIPNTGRTLLHQSVTHDRIELLTLAVLYNANINKQCKEGTTALHIACSLNRKNMLTYLLQKGAKLDIVDQDGYTPYQRAVFYSNYELAEIIEQFQQQQQGD